VFSLGGARKKKRGRARKPLSLKKRRISHRGVTWEGKKRLHSVTEKKGPSSPFYGVERRETRKERKECALTLRSWVSLCSPSKQHGGDRPQEGESSTSSFPPGGRGFLSELRGMGGSGKEKGAPYTVKYLEYVFSKKLDFGSSSSGRRE